MRVLLASSLAMPLPWLSMPASCNTLMRFNVGMSRAPLMLHTRGMSVNHERWGAEVETQKNVRGEIGGWGRVPFNETYAPSLSTIYDGA